MITVADMKDAIPFRTVVFAFVMFHILISHVELYNLRCPSQANWIFRAGITCNSISKYVCLYSIVEKTYVEGCNGPDWDRKGSKRIFSGAITRGNCSQNRYQPIIFQTNGSMSDCIYVKTICSEEGQVVYRDDLTKEDRKCRCDHTKNYSFITIPRNICYCIPSEEDCSCYNRFSRVNYTDYDCTQSGYRENPRQNVNKHNETTFEEKQPVELYSFWFHTRSKPDMKYRTIATVSFDVFFIIIIVGVLLAVVFDKMSSKTLHQLKILFQRRTSGALKRDDVNYLRLIHILFRIAFPVVRMKLDNEKKVHEIGRKMDTWYIEKNTFINEYPLSLSNDHVKVETGKYKISSVYPDTSDISDSAMLSRIKYIRNTLTRRFESNISEDKFKQCWNDIRQAVQSLVCKLDNKNDQEKTRRIEDLKLTSHLIPEASYLHHQDYTFADLTTEENNFLIIFYVIAKIVYPVIKNEFNTHCTYWRFEDICQKQHLEEHSTKQREKILTYEHQQPQYSPKMEESRNWYLSMMISKLRIKAAEEDWKDYIEQLDVINDIRREIVQSSSGMLNEERLHDILTSTRKAVLYFGGKWSEEKILRLQHLESILDQSKQDIQCSISSYQ